MFRWLLISTLFVSSFATIKDCNTNSVFRPKDLGVVPDPPVPGKPVHLTLIFNNPGPEIDDGTVSTSLTINGMPFPISKTSICESTACPIITGWNDRSTDLTWPQVSGNIKSHIKWTDVDGQELLCLDMNFKVPSGNFWDIFNNIKNVYHNNKKEIHDLYKSFKTLAEKNNLRGIFNEIQQGTDEDDDAELSSSH